MNPIDERKQILTRRSFLSLVSSSLGVAALSTLLNEDLHAQGAASPQQGPGLAVNIHVAWLKNH